MMGCVRLYLEVKESVPAQHRPAITTPIIDCPPEEARGLRRRLQRQGYTVLAIPL
jgi:hypothetical protein